jgi:hypothetical protein
MPDGQPAPLLDDTNPYASPEAPTDPNWKLLQEIEGAWRRGDEMLLAGDKSKTPRACWISNRVGAVYADALSSAPKRVIIPLLFLFAVPVLGVLFLALLELLDSAFGWFPSVKCWSRRGLSVRHLTVKAVAYLLIMAGCIGANVVGLALCDARRVGLLDGLTLYAPALLALTAGIALSAVLPRATLGLTVERQEDGLIHVRGVHPDYLARLPEYPGQERGELSSQAAEAAPGSGDSRVRWPGG